jgi:hypothetical protein
MTPSPTPFQDRLRPAPKTPAYQEAESWIWCGSPVRGEDGRYHLFASRWSKEVMFLHWATNSEIVRAAADRPEGPYRFEETVIGPRDPAFWDGQVAHNPAIRKCGEDYLLFYTGTTFRGSRPRDPGDGALFSEKWIEAWNGKRVGLATAKSVLGPWTRAERPLLETRAGAWDSVITSNPAPWVHEDGRVRLLYKSTDIPHPPRRFPGRFHFGMAGAEHWSQPLRRLLEEPVSINGNSDHHLEDGYIWWNGAVYEMIAKDMTGEVCGEPQAAIHAVSADGLAWTLAERPKAYSRTVLWEDGSSDTLPKLERPQLLFQDGAPTHLFTATLRKSESGEILDSYNLVIPLG